MHKDSKIYVAGHLGLVGSAIVVRLRLDGYENLILKTHKELDLTDEHSVADFFSKEKPDYVFLAAAKVGGIKANNIFRADFIYQNLQIQNNIVHQSYLNGVKKLLFLGSSCIYPKHAAQPMREDMLLTGELEYTNEPYAIAKIAGIKMCESYNIQYGTNFISVMPTNLYGPNDNFDLENSHVLPAMIRKIYLAKLLDENNYLLIAKNLGLISNDLNEINLFLEKFGVAKINQRTILKLWGSGTPYREFLHVDDMADACLFAMKEIDFKYLLKDGREIRNTHINIGTGEDLTIKELAHIIKKEIGFLGDIEFDKTKPDGTMKKLQDVSKLKDLGWTYRIKLIDGIKDTINYYLTNKC